MGVMNRFKDMFKGEDEYDVDGYNDGYDSYDDVADEGGVNESVQAQPQPAARDMRSNGGVLSASALEMKVIKPDRFEAVTQIAEHLLAHKTVVLNLEETNKETIRRIIDFMSGVAFAIEGNIKRVAAALETVYGPAPVAPAFAPGQPYPEGSMADIPDAADATPGVDLPGLLTEEGGFSSALAEALLQNDAARAQLAAEIAAQMAEKGYAGLDVDFEYLPGQNAAAYADFIRQLREEMQRVY